MSVMGNLDIGRSSTFSYYRYAFLGNQRDNFHIDDWTWKVCNAPGKQGMWLINDYLWALLESVQCKPKLGSALLRHILLFQLFVSLCLQKATDKLRPIVCFLYKFDYH